MSTNPNNAVGTNGAFGGRTSVNAFNDIMGAFQSRGVLSGWGVTPSSGMTVSVGGSGTTRDVAVAEDASGNKTSVNNISGAPILVTLDSAPASNSRYDAIVAYVDKPPMGNATQDNPECCGIIPVTGTAASTPAYPDDGIIRSAITSDGASGATAYYAILGYVLVASGTTTITSGMITTMLPPALNASIDGSDLTPDSVTYDKIDYSTYNSTPVRLGTWHDGRELWRKTITASITVTANTPFSTGIATGISTYNKMVGLEMRIDEGGTGQTVDLFNYYSGETNYFRAFFRTNTIQIRTCATQAGSKDCVFTVYYTV